MKAFGAGMGEQTTTGRSMGALALAGMLLLSVVAGGAVSASAEDSKGGPRAIIKTKLGDIELKLFPELAPKHVENFVKLAKSGFYNGTIFHRVIPGFMIQGGDPNTKDPGKKETYGMGGPGYTIKAEFNDTPHKRGILSAARQGGNVDTAGSQFFIVVEDSRFLDRQYTVFGEVTKGMGVADKIVNAPRNRSDLPNERIEMTVTIVE